MANFGAWSYIGMKLTASGDRTSRSKFALVDFPQAVKKKILALAKAS